MSSSAFTPKIHAWCINGEDVGCSKQQGKTFRKSFTLSTAQSRPKIMQQVLRNCQSVQQCQKHIQCSGYSITSGMNNPRVSHLNVHPTEIRNVPHTSSLLNSNTTSSLDSYNITDVAYVPSRTKNDNIRKGQKQILVPNRFNMPATSITKDVEMEHAMDFTGRNSIPELKQGVSTMVNHLRNKKNTSNKKPSSTFGFRIKRLRTSPATEAAATTTAWVNTLLISWLVVQELFLVCPPCHARSTTAISAGNPDAKRLYDDLLSNYNKLVRPVVNTTDALQVMIKLKLSQLIDVVSTL